MRQCLQQLLIALFMLGNSGCGQKPDPSSTPVEGVGTSQNALTAGESNTGLAPVALNENQAKAVHSVPLVLANDVPRTLTASGVVEMRPGGVAVQSAPEVARVVDVYVELGQQVSKGQSLMRLDASAVAVARADIQRSRALSSRAEQMVAQEQQLAELNATNRRDQTLAKQEFELAQAELAGAYGRLKAWGASAGTGSSVVLRAPMAGIVTRLDAVSGAVVDAGGVLARIVDPTAWALRIWVPQASASRVANGQLRVSLQGDPAEACTAKNLGHLHQVTPDLRAVPFRAQPDAACADRLLEGASVTVALPLRSQPDDATLYQAPVSALSTYGGQALVFVGESGATSYTPMFARDTETWGELAYFHLDEGALNPSSREVTIASSGVALLKGELMRGELE